MTITNTTLASPTYNGNGSTTAFATGFQFISNSDLQVVVTDANGVETIKTITTHYTVTGAGVAGGGTVTFLTAPASGTFVNIKSNVTLDQQVDYVEGGAFSASAHEGALDKLTKITQQIKEITDRSLTLPIVNQDIATQTNAVQPGYILRVNTAGDALEWSTASDISLSGLDYTDGNFIVGDGTEFVTEGGSTARASLGLGSIATQAASAVTITGGAITGITDIAVADGGTGASTAAGARTNLGLGTLATQDGTFSGTSSGTNTGDQLTFKTIAVSGQTDVVADSATDTLTLVAGSNVTITTDAITDAITINASLTGSGVTGPGASSDGELAIYSGTGGDTIKRSNTLNGAVTLTSGVVSAGTLGVANGGTGVATLTTYAPIFGGTTGTGAVQSGTVGTSGQVLTSNGAGALPTFQTISAPSAAVQSDQETATSTTTFVSPGRQQYHPSASKAWGVFTSITTTTLGAGYNVTSLTDNGTGNTTVNLTTAFSSTNYCVVFFTDLSIATLTNTITWNMGSRSTGSFVLVSSDSSGVAQDHEYQAFTAFGDQ